MTRIARCQCGTTSPPLLLDDELDQWEDEHTQHHCPAYIGQEWADWLDGWSYPRLPEIVREATTQAPEYTTTRGVTRTRLRSEQANDYLAHRLSTTTQENR